MAGALDLSVGQPLSEQLETAIRALSTAQCSAFLRACAIDVLPLWPAPETVISYLWTGDKKPSDDLFALALRMDRIEQSAALAAFAERRSWLQAARAEALRHPEEHRSAAHVRFVRRQLACARALEGRPLVDLAKYRPIWDALEQRMPLTEILQWGEVEDAWVEADRRQS